MGKKGIKNSNAKIALEKSENMGYIQHYKWQNKNSCERKRRPFYSFSDILFMSQQYPDQGCDFIDTKNYKTFSVDK